MRAVDCPVARADHIHARDDSSLATALLEHVGTKHRDAQFDADAARSLIAEAAYADSKHGGPRRSWATFVGRITTGTDLAGEPERRR
jgi:hypothetical protein